MTPSTDTPPVPYRIERTRNRNSRAVLVNDTIVIRLARNLSMFEEQRHIESLFQRMKKMVLRNRERPLVDPYFDVSEDHMDAVADMVNAINARTLQVPIRQIRLRAMQSQWGSCSPWGDITLNKALLKLPQHLLEYVIIHELAHRIVKNHSKRFWDLVRLHCPSAFEDRKELRKYRIAREG